MEADKTLQRRMAACNRYRRRRDRKLAIDLLGREFELQVRDELYGLEWARLRLDAYNPANHTVRLRPVWDQQEHPTIAWDTDKFWSLYRTGLLRDA